MCIREGKTDSRAEKRARRYIYVVDGRRVGNERWTELCVCVCVYIPGFVIGCIGKLVFPKGKVWIGFDGYLKVSFFEYLNLDLIYDTSILF